MHSNGNIYNRIYVIKSLIKFGYYDEAYLKLLEIEKIIKVKKY